MESGTDKTVFWASLYINTFGWFILFIYEVITLTPSWALITLAMFVFSATNLYGYFRCSKDQKNKLASLSKGAVKTAIKKGGKMSQEMANK
ncbi:MAG: DUF846 domain-containing protein [archaeon]|nr:DUF846 domain-containing protein [archaeon]